MDEIYMALDRASEQGNWFADQLYTLLSGMSQERQDYAVEHITHELRQIADFVGDVRIEQFGEPDKQ